MRDKIAKPWTPAEHDKLRDLIAKKISMIRCTIQLRRTEYSIKRRAITLGLKTPKSARKLAGLSPKTE